MEASQNPAGHCARMALSYIATSTWAYVTFYTRVESEKKERKSGEGNKAYS